MAVAVPDRERLRPFALALTFAREPLRPLAWVSAAVAGGLLLHVDRVPLWVPVAGLILILWRLAAAVRPVRLPGGAARTLLALALVGSVLAKFSTLNGLSAGTALLVLMSAIKLLETRQRRDQFIVIGGALFLLLAACLDRQNLARAPLYALQAWLCCSALAVVAYEPERPSTGPGRPASFDSRAACLLAGRTLLLAAPLALLLFLFFPRLPGAFWAIPRSDEAITGLTDVMTPGSISQLTTSYDIAFRVRFSGATPDAQDRYWRGPVLHDFDGQTWRRGPVGLYRQERTEFLGEPYRYRVSLEPSRERWWFALDTPVASPAPGVILTHDHQLIASQPVTEPTSYDAVSYTRPRSLQSLSMPEWRRDTMLPAHRNPRTRQLAQTLRERAGSDAAVVVGALEFLRTQGFVYSLTPPRLGFDSTDDFLFATRSGFCGHYASAFAMLLRAAGIPARIVTGYLGGEWNPIGGYFIVRQADAHAWTEVWLAGQGWVRVDPTAVVAPDRLRRDLLDLLPDAGSAQARLVRASPWLTDLLQRWDTVNAWWNDHVVNFDYRVQLNLLDRLGIDSPDLRHLGWAFVLGLLGWLSWIAWEFSRSAAPRRPDRLARAYLRLCRRLARSGIPREAHQGPLAYADALRERRPDLAPSIGSLLVRYAELRYGPSAPNTPAEVAAFERAVSGVRLR